MNWILNKPILLLTWFNLKEERMYNSHDSFLYSQRLLCSTKIAFFYLYDVLRHTFSAEWRAAVSTFFLLSRLPFPLSRHRVLIAIQGARRQSHHREVFSLRRCTLLSRIMKLESRPICGPCGAIFFNYSYRSSAPSGGKRQASAVRCRK